MKNEFYFVISQGNIIYEGQAKRETDEYVLIAESQNMQFDEDFCESLYSKISDVTSVKAMLKGLYTVVVYDKKNKKVFAYQDDYAYLSHLYYIFDEESFYCSLSLNSLIILRDRVMHRFCNYSLNSSVLREFLYSGFICGDDTLLNEVKKLPVLYSGIYHAGTFDFFKSIKGESPSDEDYLGIFEKELVHVAGPINGNKNITLSSGFDSNLILSVLKKHGYSVTAYTGTGINDEEFVAADEICKYYGGIDHRKISVVDDLLENYPRIVVANEGALYERGIFLHYRLAEVLASNRVETIISGDGCDQVVSKNFVFMVTEREHIGEVPHNPWETNPFEMLSYIVLKKSGGFLRKLGITPVFPYLDEAFLSVAKNFRSINGIDKSYHKAQVIKYIGQEVSDKLKRKGGATEMAALFSDIHVYNRCKQVTDNSKFTSVFPPQPDRYGKIENECDDILKVLYLMIFEKIYTTEQYRISLENDANIPWLSDLIKE